MIRLVFTLLIFAFLPFFPAFAQGSSSTQPEKQYFALPVPEEEARQKAEEEQKEKIRQLDVTEIPPEYLQEMEEIYQQCSGNDVYSTYFDCRCQAMRFLDKRIELGPEVHHATIMYQINKECTNTPAIAGYAHGVCKDMMLLRSYKGYEELCECFANTYASEYAKKPDLRSRNLISLQRDAYIACGMVDDLVKRALKKRGRDTSTR
jgi:hypothetical protein